MFLQIVFIKWGYVNWKQNHGVVVNDTLRICSKVYKDTQQIDNTERWKLSSPKE